MAALVETTIFPAEQTASFGVGRITGAESVAITPIRLGANVDRNGVRLGVRCARQHFDGGKILTVVECELRTQKFGRVVRRALRIAQITTDEGFVETHFCDVRATESVAWTGVEHERDAGASIRFVDLDFATREIRLGVAERRRSSSQLVFDAVVRAVIEARTGTQSVRGDDAAKRRQGSACAAHVEQHFGEHDRPTGVDVDARPPTTVAGGVDASFNHWFVIAEGSQGGGGFAFGALL